MFLTVPIVTSICLLLTLWLRWLRWLRWPWRLRWLRWPWWPCWCSCRPVRSPPWRPGSTGFASENRTELGHGYRHLGRDLLAERQSASEVSLPVFAPPTLGIRTKFYFLGWTLRAGEFLVLLAGTRAGRTSLVESGDAPRCAVIHPANTRGSRGSPSVWQAEGPPLAFQRAPTPRRLFLREGRARRQPGGPRRR